jgi:Flp pilus assembly CpaE family ATPase
VTVPDLASVSNTKRSLDVFARLQYDPAKTLLVVNRHDAKDPLSQQMIEEALGRSVQWAIPNDYATVVRAINQGTPLRLVHPNSRVTTTLDRLVTTHLLERPETLKASAPPRFWQRLRLPALMRREHGTA